MSPAELSDCSGMTFVEIYKIVPVSLMVSPHLQHGTRCRCTVENANVNASSDSHLDTHHAYDTSLHYELTDAIQTNVSTLPLPTGLHKL